MTKKSDIHLGCPHYIIMTRGYIHSIHGTLTRAKKAIRKSMKTWEIYEVHPDHSFERVVSYKVMDETPVSVVGN